MGLHFCYRDPKTRNFCLPLEGQEEVNLVLLLVLLLLGIISFSVVFFHIFVTFR